MHVDIVVGYKKLLCCFVDWFFFVEAQVFVAAFRKRNLPAPENLMEMREEATEGTCTSIQVLERTSGFK